MADQTSIWKKEIKLRKRGATAAADVTASTPEPRPPSIWKREIGSPKKAKPDIQDGPVAVPETKAGKRSVWKKKELRIRRSVTADRAKPEPPLELLALVDPQPTAFEEALEPPEALRDGDSELLLEDPPALPDARMWRAEEPTPGVNGSPDPIPVDNSETDASDIWRSPADDTGIVEEPGGHELATLDLTPETPTSYAADAEGWAVRGDSPEMSIDYGHPEPESGELPDDRTTDGDATELEAPRERPSYGYPSYGYPGELEAELEQPATGGLDFGQADETEPESESRAMPPTAYRFAVRHSSTGDETEELPDPSSDYAYTVGADEDPERGAPTEAVWSFEQLVVDPVDGGGDEASPADDSPSSGSEDALGAIVGGASSEDGESPTAATVDRQSEVPAAGLIAPVAADELETPDAPERSEKPRFGRKPRGSERGSKAARAATQVVGVRLGSSQIVVAVVRNTPGQSELTQLVSVPLERGIIVAGEVREPDALAAELKAVFSKHKLPRKGIRLGIASSRVGVRTVEVPAIDDPKLFENAIRFRAQEVLPISLADAILDHVVLGDVQMADGPGHRVLLAFAHRELVDRYIEAFKTARLKISAIDFEAFALLRAVTPRENGTGVAADRATVAVAVGQERTIFAVAEGSICDFTRVLEWGGGALTVAVARALDMTPSQAEPVKRALTLDGSGDNADLSVEQTETARSATRAELQVFARELLASLQFYQSRPGSLAIGEILLTGGGAELKGLPAELQDRLGVPVRVIDPFEQVRPAKKAKVLDDRGATAIAIGLGIEA